MQELNMVEVNEVGGGEWVQVTGFLYYWWTGDIIWKNTDTGANVVI